MTILQNAREAPLTTYRATLSNGVVLTVTNVINGMKTGTWYTFVFKPVNGYYGVTHDVVILPVYGYCEVAKVQAENYVRREFGLEFKFSDIPF